jgi:hypothetical protein
MSGQSAENLEFSVRLSGTYWGKRFPKYEILLDDQLIYKDCIQRPPSNKGLPGCDYISSPANILTLEFARDLDPGEHTLCIRLVDKIQDDTRLDPSGKIDRDVLINIEDIYIDGIKLDLHQIADSIEYRGKNLQEHWVLSMGHSGDWCLHFSTPLFIWLLERM